MPRLRAVPETIAQRGDLIVERDPRRPSGRLLRQGGMEASYVDLADPRHLEFDYMRWMRIVLRAGGARRVLHIGGAGCALPRALAAANPDGLQEVCEVEPEVLEMARVHLGLRRSPGLRVRLAEGRAHLRAQPAGSWDAVVIDAFSGALVPRGLVTAEALAEAARVTSLALINVVDDRAAREVRLIAAGLMTAFPRVWALGGRTGNTVLVGDAAGVDLERVRARAAADSSPGRLAPPEAVARLVAGTPPLRDADTTPAR